MTKIWLQSVSLFGPGFLGWPQSKEILKNISEYNKATIPAIESRFLSANNKRRTSPHMQIAIQAADHALSSANVDETSIELIFTSSEGDMDVAEDNLQALAHKEKEISPQKFQNVILNAAAGHLGIFMKNHSGSTTVSGENNVFCVGLLQTYSTLLDGKKNALLVAYDAPSQMPYMPKEQPFFSVGLVFDKDPNENSLAGLNLKLLETTKVSKSQVSELEKLRSSTASAACLPLLTALANRQCEPIELYYSKELILEVQLCF